MKNYLYNFVTLLGLMGVVMGYPKTEGLFSLGWWVVIISSVVFLAGIEGKIRMGDNRDR